MIGWLINKDKVPRATLGKAMMQLIINKILHFKILLRSSSVITKGIEQIYKYTKSKRKPNERASSSALQEKEEEEEKHEEEEEEEEEARSAELIPFEKEMNENPLLRLPTEKKTTRRNPI